MSDLTPPMARLAARPGKWTLSIVLYPSGPYLEIVEHRGESPDGLVYCEQLANINRAAEVLKERNPDA